MLTKNINRLEANRPYNLTIIGVSIVSLFFLTQVADPFNTPKLIALLILSGWLSGYIVDAYRNRKIVTKQNVLVLTISILFLTSMLFSLAFSDLKITSLIGDTFRRNGFLAYYGVIVVFLAAYLFSTLKTISVLFSAILFTNLFMALYGLAQIFDRDPISWINPYNSMIGTLGNPNFASAMLAIFSVTLGFGVIAQIFSKKHKLLALTTIGISLVCVIYSQSRQGILVILFSVLFYVLLILNLNYKKLKLIYNSIAALIFIVITVGMLNLGPLAQYLYKESVSVRGYYWHAAIEMFKSNWIFGVGLDRYGSYFKEFREPEYGLRYGFEISSNNAHNIPLQLFATGGILTGVLYLALIALVLFRSVKYLKLVELGEQKIVLALLSGWIGYLAQAIISIDNIGVSIWGWLLAGSLLGVSKPSDNLQSFNEKYATSNRKASVNVIRPVTSILATVFMSVLCFNIFQSESNMYKLKSVANSLPESKIYVEKFAEQVLNNKLADPTYQAQAVDFLLQAGYLDKGNLAFNKLFNSDPRNLSYLQILAENEERLANYTEAIKYRNLISKYDPWNAQNYLDIIDLLIKTNNINKANEIKNKLTTFAADTEYSKIATEILRNS